VRDRLDELTRQFGLCLRIHVPSLASGLALGIHVCRGEYKSRAGPEKSEMK